MYNLAKMEGLMGQLVWTLVIAHVGEREREGDSIQSKNKN